MTRPKNSFENYWDPKKTLGPPKAKTTPKLSQNQMLDLKGTKKKKFCTTWVNPKTIFKLDPDPKNSSYGPQKAKRSPLN